MSEFWLQVNGGLASRMRAVVGAMALCEQQGKHLIVDWPEREPGEESGKFLATMEDIWRNPPEFRPSPATFKKDKAVLEMPGSVQFRSCMIEDFLPYLGDRIRDVAVRLGYSDLVKREMFISAMMGRSPSIKIVGVNIRSYNNQPGVAPISWFMDRMGRFSEDILFFLSTDCKVTEQEVVRTFQDRVLRLGKDYVYDRMGILRTAAEMYLMAHHCDWVIGSNHSSFSQMVAFLRGAIYRGPHHRPNGLEGGRYEDMWNSPDEKSLEAALA